MKKEDSSPQEIHLHEHNAPTYNINIGYVDKQINGDYYEFRHPENAIPEDENINNPDKQQGQPKKVLFIKTNTNNEEDIAVKKREAERVKAYVKKHHLSDHKLSTKKSDVVNGIIVAFLKRWKDNGLIGEHIPGAAVFRFLTEDVGMDTEVTQAAYAAKITKFVTDVDVSIETEKEIGKLFK